MDLTKTALGIELGSTRTYAGHRKLKQLLDDGALGEITRANLANSRFFRTKFYLRSGSWRSR